MGITRQRKLIARIIHDSTEHLSAEAIHSLAQRDLPGLSLATVYRNLGLMIKEGSIRRIAIPGGDRFDKTTQVHGHYYCVKCHKVFDIYLDTFALALQLSSSDLKVIDCELVVRCLCSQCIEA